MNFKKLFVVGILSSSLFSCTLLKTPSKENDSEMKKNVEALQKKQEDAIPNVDFQTYEDNRPK